MECGGGRGIYDGGSGTTLSAETICLAWRARAEAGAMVPGILASACRVAGKRLYQVFHPADLRSDQRSIRGDDMDNLLLSASLRQTRLHQPHDMLIFPMGHLP